MRIRDLTLALLDEDKIKFHKTLNPKIWNGFELKEQVGIKLMEIASNFIAYLDIDGFNVQDIIFTGSMANYNYTDQSDIDLHVICDFSKLPTDCPLLANDFVNSKKKIYNDKHNIKIYGYDVELYVEDIATPALAGGKYSVLFKEWIKKPTPIDFEVDDVIDSAEFKDLIKRIKETTESGHNIEEANEILNDIYEMRKSGLAQGGEFSFENLLFKALRNRGYLDDLRTYINDEEDLSLSLNEQSFKQAGEELKNLNESLEFYTSVKDSYDNELQCRMTASENGKNIGYIDFSVYNEQPYIQMIQVKEPYRRKGYATKMIKQLQKDYPDSEIDFGMTTDDGTKLLNNIPFNVKVNPEYDKKVNQAKKLKKWLDEFKEVSDKIYQQIDNDEPIDEKSRLYIVNNTEKWQKYKNKLEEILVWLEENKRETRFVKVDEDYQMLDEMVKAARDSELKMSFNVDKNENRNGAYFKMYDSDEFGNAKHICRVNMLKPEIIPEHDNSRNGKLPMKITNSVIKNMIKMLHKTNTIIHFYKTINNWQALIMAHNLCLGISEMDTYNMREETKTNPKAFGFDYKMPDYSSLIK